MTRVTTVDRLRRLTPLIAALRYGSTYISLPTLCQSHSRPQLCGFVQARNVPSNLCVLPSETLKPHLTYPSIPIVISCFHTLLLCFATAGGARPTSRRWGKQTTATFPTKLSNQSCSVKSGVHKWPGYKACSYLTPKQMQVTSPHLTYL